jgi:hypothetical protein
MHLDRCMKRMACFVPILALLAALPTSCMVGRHGHVSLIAPPALILAAAIAASARPGYVWVEGHWDWVDGNWAWTEGEWIMERPGLFWVQGVWIHGGSGYYWQPGRWSDRPSVRVHDER